MRRQPIFFGWWVVLSCAIISLWAGGIFYGFTAFVNPIVKEFDWTYLAVSLAASLRSVEMGVLGPVMGFLADRFGPRKVVILCGLISGVGFLLLSRTASLAMFYVAFFILSIGSSGLGQVVTTTAVANWFKRKVGRATGLAITGYGAGGVLLPLMVWLINSYGWRVSLAILGFSTWLIIFPASILLRHKPEQYGYLPDGESLADIQVHSAGENAAYPEEIELSASHALRTRTFWLLAFAFAIQFLVLNAVTLHVMPYFTSVGLSEGLAALVAMFIPLSSIAGRLSFGWLGDILDKRHVLTLSFFLQAIGLVFFCYGRALWQFIVFLAFFGPAFGGALALRSAMLREYFGRKSFGSIQGLIIGVMTIGGIFGPAFAGWVFDLKGSYQIAWLIFILATLVAMPPILAIRKHSF